MDRVGCCSVSKCFLARHMAVYTVPNRHWILSGWSRFVSLRHGNRAGGTEMAQSGWHYGLVRLHVGVVFVAGAGYVLEMAELGDSVIDTVYLVGWILFVSVTELHSNFV